MIAFDRHFGELLDALDKRGLLEDSVVIFTSDHGESLREKHVLPTTLTHMGNPSFEQVLRVPLIVAPPCSADASQLVRSEDVRNLIRRIAGLGDEPGRSNTMELTKEELYLTERTYQTYRKGHWKSFWPRDSGRMYLVDLDTDPEEMNDVAAAHPEIMDAHRKRVTRLTQMFASSVGRDDQMSEEDVNRLRALGYLPSE